MDKPGYLPQGIKPGAPIMYKPEDEAPRMIDTHQYGAAYEPCDPDEAEDANKQ
jgi:hypothetical protein